MPTIMTDLLSLIDQHIPEGRQSLQDSHANLDKVAEYCEANYFEAGDKRSAIEESKLFTTQSLASVAYQINTVAFHLLQMLDLEANVLAEMESEINHITQTVSIHKEKVARREIGVLTTTKNTSRQHKILAPSLQERPIKYIRKPVDYTVLDDIGHGIKSSNTPRSKRTLAPIQNPLNGNTSAGPAPTTKPPTPPQPVRAGGSLSRGTKEYRTPAPPIAPPQIPSNYAPNYPVGHPRSVELRRGSGYSTLPILSASQSSQMHSTQPQIGMVHPMTHSQHSHALGPSSPVPPPPPDLGDKNLLELPMHVSTDFPHPPGNISPPLPPPPPEDDNLYHENYNPPSPPPFLRGRVPDWVPKNYVEKVVAIYDYCADKEDELSFSENSIIYVLKKNDDGWFEGVMDGGLTGLFPGNYVEPCI